jgi:hypothetical protein
MTINLSELIPDVGCPATLLPKPGDLAIPLKKLASLPAILTVLGYKEIADQIRSTLKTIDDILGNFPISISKPFYGALSLPEIEWELKARAIVAEFKLFLLAKVLEIINTVIDGLVTIPVPFLGNVNIVRLFSDPEYRAEVKSRITKNLNGALAIVGRLGKSFNGEFGLKSPEMQIQEIWSWFIMEITNIATNILYEAIKTLIRMFDSLWRPFGFSIIALLTCDIETIIEDAIASVSKLLPIEQYYKMIIATLKSINIFGFTLLDLLGGAYEDVTESAELTINRLISAAKDFSVKYPLYVLENWILTIKEFLKKIPGLGLLFDDSLVLFPFTFCSFLQLIGFPTSFAGLIPATLPVTVDQITPTPNISG